MSTRECHELQRECKELAAQGGVLLNTASFYIDPDMSAFIGTYLCALQSDFDEAISTEGHEGGVRLQLVLSEMRDLVSDMQRRIERGKAGTPPLGA